MAKPGATWYCVFPASGRACPGHPSDNLTDTPMTEVTDASRHIRLLIAGLIATRIAACRLIAMALSRDVEASPVDGAWCIRGLALHIFDCQRLVCSRIVWLNDPGLMSVEQP
jgi:hypothetical protein